MNHLPKLLLVCLTLISGLMGAAKQDSTSKKQISSSYVKGLFTEEQRRFYQVDAFPLSLAERGRQSVTALRGMPPGLISYRFGQQLLDNPVTGLWNEQLLPLYRIGSRAPGYGSWESRFLPEGPVAENPITDITFFQDFVSGLAYLDLDFRARINETDFFQLAGNNFVRDGTRPFLQSRTKVNTYQARYHRRIAGKWRLDGNYWQLRQRYALPPENPALSISRDKFKQVRHLAWAQLSTRLSENDSLIIVPTFSDLDDNYWQTGNRLRQIRARWAGVTGLLLHRKTNGTIGVRFNARYLHSAANQFWEKRNEWQAEGAIFWQKQSSSSILRAETGLVGHQQAGLALSSKLKWEWSPPEKSYSLGLEVFDLPRPLPLLWRAIKSDSLPAANGNRFIRSSGISFTYRKRFTPVTQISFTPFYARTGNYPVLQASLARWQSNTFSNSGFIFRFRSRLWKFAFENDFAYNKDYQNVFAPQFNNVTKLQTGFDMFQRALRLKGTLVSHVIGKYRRIEYQRLITQYSLGAQTTDPIFIADFLLEAKIRQATLYFVWENLLSQDYEIVSGQGEFFRIFRLGIRWRLFD